MTSAGPTTTCYRHPQTAAGVSCQRCDRPICTQCMNQASVGFHCPECMASSSQRVVRGSQVFAGQEPYVTYALIAINVLIFFGEQATGGFNGAISAAAVGNGDWWRVITAGFLHVSMPHLLMNMFALYQLGPTFEKLLGRVRFVLLYMGALVAGSLGVIVFELLGDSSRARGASGAIFGLIGALVVVYRSRGITIAQSGLMPVLAINAFISFLPGISLAGHLGGFIGGAVGGAIAFMWDDQLENYHKEAVGIALGGLAVLWFVLSVVLA